MPNTLEHKTAEGAWGGVPDGTADRRSWFFEWYVGVCWIVLIWTWMNPVARLSGWMEPEKIVPIYAAAAFYILADVLRCPALLGVPLKAAATLLCVGWLFGESGGHSGLGLDWLKSYAGISAHDARAIAGAEWDNVSPENRTVIFLLGWALLAGVIQSIILHRKRAFWLAAVTWGYLVALQLWPGMDTTRELLAAAPAGLVLLTVLHMQRIKRVYASGLKRRIPAKAELGKAGNASGGTVSRAVSLTDRWTPEGRLGSGEVGGAASLPSFIYAAAFFVIFILFTAALSGAGTERGVMEPLQADTLDRIVKHLGLSGSGQPDDGLLTVQAMSGAQAFTGYGPDDSRLGGPLSVRDEPVFTARTPELTYWRGESKNYYDGRGWTSLGDGYREAGTPPAAAETVPAGASRRIRQEVLYPERGRLNVLFAGGSVEKVETAYTLEGRLIPERALVFDPESGRHSLLPGWGGLGFARMEVRLPSYKPEELITLREEYNGEAGPGYLQLPDKLPDRVRKLAADTAGKAPEPYAKALMIERYLKEHYRYSLTEVPSVPKDGDFVDTFLFEGTGGYCDYFSTAMTVLLRAQGVPARWVKGFAPGEVISDNTDGMWTVQVSSRNAHSWVEVYIPGAGWIPFDPTPGFSGFPGQEEADKLAVIQTELGPQAESGKNAAGSAVFAWTRNWLDSERIRLAVGAWMTQSGEVLSALWKRYRLVAAAAVLTLLPILYLSRTGGRLLSLQLLLRYRRRGARRPMLALKLLDRLWLRVFRCYGTKAPGQTLREYAEEIGLRVPGVRDPLMELVRLYEHVRYAGEQPPWLPRQRMAELWRRLFEQPPRGRGGMPV